MAKKVLIVGTNPSEKSTSLSAFHHSTKSGRLLEEWLLPLEKHISSRGYTNICFGTTPNNRPLNKKEIEEGKIRLTTTLDWFQPEAIVAVGKIATKVLTEMGLRFYELPHPSGCNRLLNDPKYITEKIKGLEAFLQLIP